MPKLTIITLWFRLRHGSGQSSQLAYPQMGNLGTLLIIVGASKPSSPQNSGKLGTSRRDAGSSALRYEGSGNTPQQIC